MNVIASGMGAARPATRDPERSRERILAAAFKEFAAQGFAGARVDRVARRAGINKRMLYHYFGDKRGLFREVLRRKIAERQGGGGGGGGGRADGAGGSDRGVWVGRLIDEPKRRAAAGRAVERIRRRQRLGHLTNGFDAKRILLAMVALTWFPLAFPQLTRLITGQSVLDGRFRRDQRQFLGRFAAAFKTGSLITPTTDGHRPVEPEIRNPKP